MFSRIKCLRVSIKGSLNVNTIVYKANGRKEIIVQITRVSKFMEEA